MGFFAWIILGLVAGFIGSKVVNKKGEGFFLDIILGVIGAVVGSIVVLVVYHAIRSAL